MRSGVHPPRTGSGHTYRCVYSVLRPPFRTGAAHVVQFGTVGIEKGFAERANGLCQLVHQRKLNRCRHGGLPCPRPLVAESDRLIGTLRPQRPGVISTEVLRHALFVRFATYRAARTRAFCSTEVNLGLGTREAVQPLMAIGIKAPRRGQALPQLKLILVSVNPMAPARTQVIFASLLGTDR
jgi:hypothetical protein